MTDEWMTRANCTPNPAWTTDHKPPAPLMRHLAAICHTCPVQRDCAHYALTHPAEAHSAVFAGVWLPRTRGPHWDAARHLLHHKTTTPRAAA